MNFVSLFEGGGAISLGGQNISLKSTAPTSRSLKSNGCPRGTLTCNLLPRISQLTQVKWFGSQGIFAPGFSSRPCANNIFGVPAVVTSFPENSTFDLAWRHSTRGQERDNFNNLVRPKSPHFRWDGHVPPGICFFGGGCVTDLSKTATNTFTGNDRSQ